MSKKRELHVWDWRGLVICYAPNIAPLKHLLLTLSCYMDSVGGSCFPSIDTLVDVTSMSRPTILKYLKIAQETGWIEVEKHGLSGQQWARNQYSANVPIDVISQINKHDDSGGKAVKEVNRVNEKAVNPFNEGGKTDSERRLTSLYSNSSITHQYLSKEKKGAREQIDKILKGIHPPQHLRKVLSVDGVYDAYLNYRVYIKQSFNLWPLEVEVLADLEQLKKLMDAGNPPTDVILQTIQAKNKSFYALRNFDSKQKTDRDQEHLSLPAYKEL